MGGKPVLRHEAVQERPQTHADDDPAPDAAEDAGHLVPGETVPLFQPQAGAAFIPCRLAGDPQHAAQEGLQPAFGAEQIQQPAAQHTGRHADDHIDHGELPAQQAPEQDHGDLVDERRGDEEGHGDAQRDAGHGEAQEERDAGAGTEGRDGAERGPQQIADAPALAGKIVAYPLHMQPGPQPADAIDHQHQQKQDLGAVIEEKFQSQARGPAGRQGEQVEGQPGGQRLDGYVQARPGQQHGQQGQGVTRGGKRTRRGRALVHKYSLLAKLPNLRVKKSRRSGPAYLFRSMSIWLRMRFSSSWPVQARNWSRQQRARL